LLWRFLFADRKMDLASLSSDGGPVITADAYASFWLQQLFLTPPHQLMDAIRALPRDAAEVALAALLLAVRRANFELTLDTLAVDASTSSLAELRGSGQRRGATGVVHDVAPLDGTQRRSAVTGSTFSSESISDAPRGALMHRGCAVRVLLTRAPRPPERERAPGVVVARPFSFQMAAAPVHVALSLGTPKSMSLAAMQMSQSDMAVGVGSRTDFPGFVMRTPTAARQPPRGLNYGSDLAVGVGSRGDAPAGSALLLASTSADESADGSSASGGGSGNPLLPPGYQQRVTAAVNYLRKQ
jgi:hypothetical protein